MKYNHPSNELLDAGDFNDIPAPYYHGLFVSWLYAAALGFSLVLFAIGGAM